MMMAGAPRSQFSSPCPGPVSWFVKLNWSTGQAGCETISQRCMHLNTVQILQISDLKQIRESISSSRRTYGVVHNENLSSFF